MTTQKPFRMTTQRRIILEELIFLRSHPTAQEIHSVVRQRLPRISLGTVYRNLDLLCNQGLALKIATEGGTQNRFDGNTAAHTHVHCRDCGILVDLPDVPQSELEERAARESGFQILTHRLEFVGICPLCQAKSVV
jgi:Fur family ferric uptake transcriptional regulator